MSSLNRRSKIIVIYTALLIVLVSGAGLFTHGTAAGQTETINTTIPTMPPGLVVYGAVRDLSGLGVENVSIYRSYAGYQGVVIATTDATGYYQSDYYYIPGDEMITVWADRSGLVFTPMHYYWRHYYGYQREECNFQSRLPWVFYIPFMGNFSN